MRIYSGSFHWLFCFAVLTDILLSFSSAFAQPPWLHGVAAAAKGKIFDAKASVAVLHYSEDVKISEKLKSTTHIQAVYKVLQKSGASEVILAQPGAKNLEINNLQGWSLLPDGRILEVKKTDILRMSPFEDVAYYGDSYILGAVPPDREIGTIVAYEYDVEENGLGALFQQSTLQTQDPVVFARLTISAPKGWQLKYSGDNLEPIKIEEGAGTFTATASDLPYRPEEAFMPPWPFLARRIFAVAADPTVSNKNSIRSWQEVADWYRDILAQLKKDDRDLITTTQQVTAGLDTPADKIKAITRFVQERIRYVAVEFGKGAYVPRPAAETLDNMYGDCKDKAVLMCAMLNAAGLEGVPALTNGSFLVRSELPNPFQFNHAIVAIPAKSLGDAFANERALVKDWLFIDPTDPTTRVGDLPASLQGSHALPADAAKAELIRLPYGSASHYTREITAEAAVLQDGSVSALVTVKYLGNYAKQQRYENQFLTENEQTEQWRSLLDPIIPNVKISDVSSWAKGDTSWTRFTLKSSNYLPSNGDYWLLKPDFSIDPGQYRLGETERFHPIWFGPPRKYLAKICWHLPSGWSVVPASQQVEHEDDILRLHCSTSWQDSLLSYEYSYERTGHLLQKEEYQRARTIHAIDLQCDGMTLLIKPAAAQLAKPVQ